MEGQPDPEKLAGEAAADDVDSPGEIEPAVEKAEDGSPRKIIPMPWGTPISLGEPEPDKKSRPSNAGFQP